MEIELEVGRSMLLIGEVEFIDGSFDHEFGVKESCGVELTNFSIMLYDDGLEQDITKAFCEELIEYYQHKLLKHAALELAV